MPSKSALPTNQSSKKPTTKASSLGRLSPGSTIEPGIQFRGRDQYRVQIRERGQSFTKTFSTLPEAREWKVNTESRLLGEHKVDVTLPQRTTLTQATQWAFESGLGKKPKELCSKHEQNLLANWRWWGEQSDFSDWMLSSIRDVDLIAWVREWKEYCDIYEAQKDIGLNAKAGVPDNDHEPLERPVSSQTITHRLNALSRLLTDWRLAHNLSANLLPNPVTAGVRPNKAAGRQRRLQDGEEVILLEAARRSTRPWLVHAIVISLETAIRQAELANLTWDRVRLDDEYPHVHLDKTKNDEKRDVPLSPIAIKAFEKLRILADRHNATRAEILAAKSKLDTNELSAENSYSCVETEWTKPIPILSTRAIIHAFSDLLANQRAIDPNALNNLHWHDLRHEAVSRLFETTDLRDHEIQAITGHITSAMLSRYTHLRTKKLGVKLAGNKGKTAGKNSGELPGTVILTPGKTAMVVSLNHDMIPFAQADKFTQEYAHKMLLDALDDLTKESGH